MAPWNIKTIYGTVREEFPYVYVFAAEDLSSDTILIGSLDPLPLDLDVLERAFRDPVTRAEARRGGFAVARTTCSPTCCSAPTSWSRSPPARPSTPTTTRASSSRRRAICSATPSSIPTSPRSTARCGPTGASPSWCAATTSPTPRSAAPARRPRRAACSRTASRARRSCGPGAPRPPASRPRRSTPACSCAWCRRASIAIRRSRSRPARSWRRRSCRPRWPPRTPSSSPR